MRLYNKYYTFFIISIYLSNFLYAEETQLTPISITQKTNDIFTPHDFIGAHTKIDLEQYQNQYIPFKEILSSQVGIDIESVSGHGQYATPMIRGAEGQQVLVFENGIPLNSLNGSGADIGSLSIHGATSLDIYRGMVPMELSPTAIGGAINITKEDSNDNSGRISHTSGIYNVHQSSIVQNISTENALISGGLKINSAENNFIYKENQPVSSPSTPKFEPRHNNATESNAGFLNSTYYISKNQKINAHINTFSGTREIPGIINTINNKANITADTKQFRFSHNLNLRNIFSLNTQLTYAEASELYDDRESDVGLGTQYDSYQTQFDRVNLTVTYPQDKFKVIINQQFQNEDINIEYLNDLLSNTKDCFISGQCDRTYYRKQTNSGIRLEWKKSDSTYLSNQLVFIQNQDSPFNNSSTRFEKQFWSFHSGVSHNITDHTSFEGSYNKQLRPASANELFGDKGYTIGNPDLLPEESTGFEAMLIYRDYPNNITATTYTRDVINSIIKQQNSQGIINFDNIGKTRFTGVELTFETNITDFIDYSGSINWQSSEIIKHNVSRFIGNQLNNHRNWYFDQSLSINTQPFSASLSLSFEDGGYYDNQNLLNRQHKLNLNGNLTYTISTSTIALTLKNITNDRTETYVNTPVMGRSAYLNYNHTWSI